jgi:adenosylcobinamide-GDP ribazoletransferase
MPRDLRAAVAFLTRVPVPVGGEPNLSAAVPWFPVAGALIGAFVGGVAAGLIHIVPAFVAAAVAVMLGVLVTGAFHEDGLADVADAFAGGWTAEERIRILDDPLHGSYGVAALCGSIVVRVGCLAALGASPAVAFACAVAAHTIGRAAAVGLMAAVPVARPDGLGAEYARTLPRANAIIGVVAAIGIAAVASGWWVGPFAAGGAFAALVVGWLTKRKIGGVTGDVLGTAEQIAECLVLVVATGLATRYQLWWAR